MNRDFWIKRWAEGNIGFHLPEVNPSLIKHAELVKGRVFVPLCGKSIDMRWLAERGHEVIGLEVSTLAIDAFFQEWGVVPVRSGTRHCAAGVTIHESDFFDTPSKDLGVMDTIWDRAAFVAIMPSQRIRYAERLLSLLAPAGKILLVSFEYDPTQMEGPPFATSPADVRAAFANRTVECLDERSIIEEEPRFQQRGLTWLKEALWRIE